MDTIDLDERPDALAERYDLVVVGSGAAGLPVALEVARSGATVLLCEAGGAERDDASQDHYRGEVVGDQYDPLDVVRVRALGGSTNHWGGYCHPIGAAEWGPRPELDETAWPIPHSELADRLIRAGAYLDLAPDAWDYDSLRREADIPELLAPESGFASTAFRYGRLASIAGHLRPELDAEATLTLALNAALVDLEWAGSMVSGVVLLTPGGDTVRVAADRVVLATGGLENARLLLDIADGADGRFAPVADHLGACFMEHLNYYYTVTMLTDAATLGALSPIVNIKPRADSPFGWYQHVAATTAEWRREHDVACAASITIEEPQYQSPEELLDRPGARGVRSLHEFEHGSAADRAVYLTVRAEQVPSRRRRVTLAEGRDANGRRRLRLHWDIDPVERASIIATVQAFAGEAARQGWGRVYLDAAPGGTGWTRLFGGYHHMGTTRMSDSPADGVVDPDCRVHGIDNLYVAGSSVFPVGSWVPPTLNLIALALRLADHLVES